MKHLGACMTDYALDAEDNASGKPPLAEVIGALRRGREAPEQVISSTLIYGLSDLSPEERGAIAPAWRVLPSPFKHHVLRALYEASEAMFELNYREIAGLGLQDESGLVRSASIDLLWTDESEGAMRQLMRLAVEDPEQAVRANALKALGPFILLGEYGTMPGELAREAQRLTHALHTDVAQPLEVRRRALEALANSSHGSVAGLIRAAYDDGNHQLKISAIFAMGRTCNEIWQGILQDELQSHDNECVYEAITACGNIQLEDCAQEIGELTLSDDPDIQLAAIWALGEIGGKRAFEILSRLSETVDDDAGRDAIDAALDSASFSLSLAALDLEFDED